MSDVIIEPDVAETTTPNNRNWTDLLQYLDADFLRNNQDLIMNAVQMISTSMQDDPDKISLSEFGIESTEELGELADLVPRYNQLADAYETLEADYEDLQSQLAKRGQQLQQLYQQNKKLSGLVRKTQSRMQQLQASNQQLRYDQRLLQLQVQGMIQPASAPYGRAPQG